MTPSPKMAATFYNQVLVRFKNKGNVYKCYLNNIFTWTFLIAYNFLIGIRMRFFFENYIVFCCLKQCQCFMSVAYVVLKLEGGHNDPPYLKAPERPWY